MAVIPTTQVADGDFVAFRVHVNSGETLNVFAAGVQNASNNAPSGLNAVIRDETNGSDLLDRNTKRVTGNPVVSVSGAVDVRFAADNATGSTQDVTAHFQISIV